MNQEKIFQLISSFLFGLSVSESDWNYYVKVSWSILEPRELYLPPPPILIIGTCEELLGPFYYWDSSVCVFGWTKTLPPSFLTLLSLLLCIRCWIWVCWSLMSFSMMWVIYFCLYMWWMYTVSCCSVRKLLTAGVWSWLLRSSSLDSSSWCCGEVLSLRGVDVGWSCFLLDANYFSFSISCSAWTPFIQSWTVFLTSKLAILFLKVTYLGLYMAS